MIKKNLSGLCMVTATFILALSACSWPRDNEQEGENIGARSKAAVAMLSRLPPQQAKTIIYVNANVLKNSNNIVTVERIKHDVLERSKHYFIDFSDTSNSIESNRLRKDFKAIVGVDFFSNWLVVGAYKGDLIYSPIFSQRDPLLKIAIGRQNTGQHSALSARSSEAALPIEAFYQEVYHPITDGLVQECSFKTKVPPFVFGDMLAEKVFCKNANISLIYRINLMRSRKYEGPGSSTPDAKLVRISLDKDSSGSGISLNPALSHIRESIQGQAGESSVGWKTAYVTAAIAKDYQFSLEASNSKALILNTFPISNINSSYKHMDTSSLELGIGITASLSPKAPLLGGNGTAKITTTRTLYYDTQDYQIVRNSTANNKITFTWQREQYPTAESLIMAEGFLPDDIYPVVESRIQPISHTGFTPNFDVVYKASPVETGSTTFTLNSTVNLWPLRSGVYYYLGRPTGRAALEEWQTYRRVGAETSFEVDWDNPIFLGALPVNLQLGSVNNLCLTANDDGNITSETCDLKSRRQSFVYDSQHRYLNFHTKTCFDRRGLYLKPCNQNISQRWKWLPNSDSLVSEFDGVILSHDREGNIYITEPDHEYDANISRRTLSGYTNIF